MENEQRIIDLLQEIVGVLKGNLQVTSCRVINERFIDNGDGTITDKELKVIWIKDPANLKGFEKTMTWEEAKRACDDLCFAGYNSGWRMPTLKEEQSIRDYTRYEPAWDTQVFSGKYDNWYWTSTECAWNKNSAWCVYSYYGGVGYGSKVNPSFVRPVRSSQ